MADYEVEDFFERHIKNNLYPAVRCTLKKGTQFACAQLLCSYTEIMGGHISGNLGKRYYGTKNFNTFLEYMDPRYLELSKKINLYDVIRNGLVHEAEPKKQFLIQLSKSNPKRIGIEYYDKPSIIINFHLREYFRDFKTGINKLCSQLKQPYQNLEIYSNFINCRRRTYEKYLIEKGVRS